MTGINITALNDSSRPVSKIADRLEPYLRVLVDEFNPQMVILFGSYAYGQPTEHSDVDLLVIKPLQQSTLHEAVFNILGTTFSCVELLHEAVE